MSYHTFKSEDGQEDCGLFEVFHMTERKLVSAEWEPGFKPGWYWWACFPGCLPDGEAQGPYATEQEAIEAAQGE